MFNSYPNNLLKWNGTATSFVGNADKTAEGAAIYGP